MIRKAVFILALALSIGLLANYGWPSSDAVRETDNHDASFVGTWGTNNTPILFYGDDFRWAACSGSATITASATFNAPRVTNTDGWYSVFVRHVVHPNRTTGAKFKIYYRDNTITYTCTTNQTVKGGEWIYCGTFDFKAGYTPKVVLGNDCEGGKYVIADAVRWVKEQYNADDITDEPGIEYAAYGSINVGSLSVGPNTTNLTSVTVTAPFPGYIHVQASGIYAPGVAYKFVRVGIDDASGGTTFDGPAPILESNIVSGYTGEKRYSLSKVYPVNAGTYTFYLKALREDTETTGTLYWNDFTAVYYRTRY